MPVKPESLKPESFLIEIIRQGSYAKATAVDPRTGIEASIVGPASAANALLSRQACNKLQRLLIKSAGQP
jgi:hypothetical protein